MSHHMPVFTTQEAARQNHRRNNMRPSDLQYTNTQRVQQVITHSTHPVSPHHKNPPSGLPFPQPGRRHSDPPQPNSPHGEIPQQAGQSVVDSIVISATDNALAPVRAALDTVWSLAVTNMRLAMNKMNNDFIYLATQERQKSSHLATKVANLENQLQAYRHEITALQNERQELQRVLQGYKNDNRFNSETQQRWEGDRRVVPVVDQPRYADPETPQLDMDKMLGAVTEQVSKQMERKMSAMLDQFEEQKSLAERRFAETLQNLGHFQHREYSSSSPTVHQSFSPPNQLAQSLPLQRDSRSPTTDNVISHTSPTSPVVLDCKQVDSAIPGPSLRNSPSLTPMDQDIDQPPSQMSPVATLRRTHSSEPQPQPRKKARLTNESENESPSTNPPVVTTCSPKTRSESPSQSGPGNETERNFRNHEGHDNVIESVEDAGSKGTPPISPLSRTDPPFATIPPLAKPKETKLSIGHIDLLYKTENGIMTCRMCFSRSRDLFLARDPSSSVTAVKKFEQGTASWHELISHCIDEHPRTCKDLEKLGPTQIAEMKQRLMSGGKFSRG